MQAWHFVRSDRKLRYADDRSVKVGETLAVDPNKLKLCSYGLHASENILDALYYASGLNERHPIISRDCVILCRVELSGRILKSTDKLCASERRVVWMKDVSKEVREWSKWCASEVKHLWDPPEVVLRFLETGENANGAAPAARAYYDASAASSAYYAASAAYYAASAALPAYYAVSAASSAYYAAYAAYAAEAAQTAEAAVTTRLLQSNKLLEMIKRPPTILNLLG